MTTTDTDAPDLTGAVAYVLVDRLARADEKWFITPDDQVHYQRPGGAWTPKSILSAADIRNSASWQRVDA